VTSATLTITAANKTKVYGSVNPALTYTYAGLVNGDLAPSVLPTAATTAVTGSPVGNYSITLSGASDANYSISYVSGTLSVTSATLTITAANKTKVYGSVNPALTYTYAGLVNSDLAPSVLPTAATTAVTGSPVGNYSITLSGASDANYSINYVSGTLTIIKAILTIRAENKTKTQGDPNPAFTFTYSGFVTGENPTSLTTLPIATCSAKNNSAVGSYPIIPAGGVAANYTFVYQNGTLTITAPLIMKFEIPNAFIPTDIYVDNRYLKASYNASVQKVISFRIYNRMGKLVYELQNVNPAEIKWDGKFNDVLQESDVYMWIANVDGHLDPFRGQFLLLK
jgi:hypothetical protein